MSRISRAVAGGFPYRITQQVKYYQRVFEKYVENNSVEDVMTQIGFMPFDEEELPAEDPSVF